MTHKDFTFTFCKSEFYGQYFYKEDPKAIIIMIHGMGSHCNRYTNFVIPKLLQHDLAVITYDQFGHGKTSGKRGHNPGYNYLLDSLSIVIEKCNDLFKKSIPMFLYGHSMGGNVAINYLLRKETEFKGAIITSPLLRLAFKPPAWKLSIGKLLLNIAPSITMSSGLDSNALSRNKDQVELYNNDPLVHDKISPNYSLAVFKAGEWAIQNANKLTTNMLILHGTADTLTDYKASQEFNEKSKKHTTLKLFEGGYHELHNDLEKELFIKTITDWIKNLLN